MAMELKKKQVQESHFCISVPYGDLQSLFDNDISKVGYTAGRDGWNASIYIVSQEPSIAVVTGYRPFGKPAPREIVKWYELEAKAIRNSSISYYERSRSLYELQLQFVRECRSMGLFK